MVFGASVAPDVESGESAAPRELEIVRGMGGDSTIKSCQLTWAWCPLCRREPGCPGGSAARRNGWETQREHGGLVVAALRLRDATVDVGIWDTRGMNDLIWKKYLRRQLVDYMTNWSTTYKGVKAHIKFNF